MKTFISALFLFISNLAGAATFCFTISASFGSCDQNTCHTTGYTSFQCTEIPDPQQGTPSFDSSRNYGGGGGGGGGGGLLNPANSEADQSTCAPVYIQSGLKHFTDVDYSSSDEFGLFLVRNYSSFPVPVYVRADRKGLFGTSWGSNFDDRLSIKYSDNTVCDRSRRGNCSVSKVPEIITYKTYNTDFPFERVNSDDNHYIARGSNSDYSAPYASMKVSSLNGDIALKKKDGTISLYDVYGNLKKVTSINGVEWNYAYDSSFRLDKVVHSNGKYLQFFWNGNGVVEKVLLPNGKFINYTYNTLDSSSRAYVLNEIFYPESSGSIKYVTEYMAGSGGFLVKEKHIDGKKWGEYEYAYNSDKRYHVVTSSGYVGGVERSTFEYEPSVTRVTNANGATTVYHFDQEKRLVAVNNPQSASCPALSKEYSYHGNSNRVTRKVLQDGTELIQSFYHDTGLLAWTYNKGIRRVYRYTDHQIATETAYEDRRSYDNTCRYPVDCSIPLRTLPLVQREFTYHPQHKRLISLRERSLKSDSTYTDWRETSYQYIINTNKTIRKLSVSGHLVGGGIIEYYYNSFGDLEKITYPNGLSETFNFSNGELLQQVGLDGVSTSYMYDGVGNLKHLMINNNPNLSISYSYHVDGRPKKISSPNGFNKTYFLNGSRRVQREEYSLDTNTPQKISHIYDLLGNLQKSTLTTYAQVPCLGGPQSPNQIRLCNQWQESLDIVNNSYDENGFLHVMRTGQASSTFGYTAAGRPTTITDGNGKVTTVTYNSWGQVLTTKNALNQTITYKYNPAGKLREVVDAKGVVTRYFWNGFHEIERIESSDVGTTRIEYDNIGRVSSVTNALGVRIDYEYDSLSRLVEKKASTSNADAHSYTYDTNLSGAPIACVNGGGKLCSVVGEDVATFYSYNENGSLDKQLDRIHGKDYSRNYGYDQFGRFSQVTYPNGTAVKYEYYLDGTQKNVQVHLAGAWRNVASYEKKIDHAAINYNQGFSQKRFFNRDGRITRIQSDRLTKAYTYKQNTNLISRIDNSAASFSASNLLLSYDDVGRLTQSSDDGKFEYDANGNRSSVMVSGPSSYAEYTYEANSNRLLTAAAVPTRDSKAYVYDAVGNAIQQNGSAIRRFSYDGFGRMTGVTGNLPFYSYSYNHRNQRVYKNDHSVPSQYKPPIRYFYNQRGLIEYSISHADSAAAVPVGAGRIYIYLNGLLVGLVDGNRILDVETDHLGRPELVLHGQVIKWRAVNTALDRRLVTSSESLDVGFPGQLFDSETGLWYNWHRYYDASIGRYIQSDPIGLSGGLNLYAYAANNPTSLDDPTGLIAPAFYYAGVIAASILTAKSCMDGNAALQNGFEQSNKAQESQQKLLECLSSGKCGAEEMSALQRESREAILQTVESAGDAARAYSTLPGMPAGGPLPSNQADLIQMGIVNGVSEGARFLESR